MSRFSLSHARALWFVLRFCRFRGQVRTVSPDRFRGCCSFLRKKKTRRLLDKKSENLLFQSSRQSPVGTWGTGNKSEAEQPEQTEQTEQTVDCVTSPMTSCVIKHFWFSSGTFSFICFHFPPFWLCPGSVVSAAPPFFIFTYLSARIRRHLLFGIPATSPQVWHSWRCWLYTLTMLSEQDDKYELRWRLSRKEAKGFRRLCNDFLFVICFFASQAHVFWILAILAVSQIANFWNVIFSVNFFL